MSLRKRTKFEYPAVISEYNDTSDLNWSQYVDDNTNFILRPISYENIDEAVFIEFNKRFTISNKQIGLILIDAEVASLQHNNFEQFDTVKGYLNMPYFTVWRSGISPWIRSSPSNKPIIYTIPKKKAQGIVYEEYIMPVPKVEKLHFVFKFLSVYREHLNQFESQMNDYFKNKRNVLVLDNERFEIMPANQDERGSLEVTDREGVNGQTLYVLTYEVDVIAYTRRIEDIQKRERPNAVEFTIVDDSGAQLTQIDQVATRLPQATDNPNVENKGL